MDDQCIFERLDRILYNHNMQDLFLIFEVEHLLRNGSDHAPLLISLGTTQEHVVRPFKLLNFWNKEKYFKDVVKRHWTADFVGNPFVLF